MKLEQLSYVIEIANTGSFSQAARNLYIAQPSLSRAIKQLEEEIGAPLFERKKNGVVPTPEGIELLSRSRLIYRECQELGEMFSRREKPHRFQLRVACLHSRVTSFLPTVYKAYSDVPVNIAILDCANLQEVIQMLLPCRVDYAVIGTLSPYTDTVRADLKNADVEYHKIARSDIYAAVSSHNDLYRCEKEISLEQLYPNTIVSYSTIDGGNGQNFSIALGIDNKIKGDIRTNSYQLFDQLVHETSVIGLTSTSEKAFRQVCPYDNIKILRIRDCPIQLEYAWIKLRRLSLNDFAWETLEYQIKSYKE